MDNPLLGRPTVTRGVAGPAVPMAAILLHGRGQQVSYMFEVFDRIGVDMPCVAPEAIDASWYPQSFLAPLSANQPHLDWALERVDAEVRALERSGLTRARIALIGFSQGACLASEYAFRNPGRWAALIAFTGGLAGPEGTRWSGRGDFAGTPVLLTNGEADPFVPWRRVEQTAAAFRACGAAVDLRLYSGRAHLVSDEEAALARALLRDSPGFAAAVS